jgi:class 3 adenylate cyclase
VSDPEKIDDFRIVRELGRGGMGVVYEAIEEPLGRRVALKRMHPHIAAGADMAKRFLEEARSIARLAHPSIVKIHRFGRADETFYLALEYVEGKPLDVVLGESHVSVARAVKLLTGIAQALGHAHAAGVVHRDVKPGNVFVSAGDHVVLGDFGLAKDMEPNAGRITKTGMIMGTPAYMAPEQAQAKPVTPATDIYALGVVAFEMLSGRVPFTADSAVSLLLKHVNDAAPPLTDFAANVPPALANLVARMLEKEPARRPPDGNAVAEALAAFSGAQGDTPTLKLDTTQDALAVGSWFEEVEVTAAAFELTGFARITVQSVLPARAAFLLESWYRLAHQAIRAEGGTVDRHIADRVTAIYGYPQRHPDHTARAVRTGFALHGALEQFNKAHDLTQAMRCGVATGSALVGRIADDISAMSAQGMVMSDMQRLAKTKLVKPCVRLNRAAYRRVSAMASFTRFEEPEVGEAWATDPPAP